MIKHVLKDGSIASDISGHVIAMDKFKSLYKIIDHLNKKGNTHEAV